MVDEEALRAFYEEASQAQNGGQANPNPFKKPACIFCKKRKIKCDFQMPCFQCCKRGHECSYEEPKKKWTATVKATPSQLAAKVDQLTAELELQKHMAQYWQKQYQQKSQVKDFTPVPIPNKRPLFSGSAAELCLNVGAAVLKVSQAFSDLMGAMMPHSTSSFSPELSALFWNRLVTNSPEDLVTTTKCMNADSIAQLLIHSSIFALGSALINEQQLANHFYSTANILLSMTTIRNVRTTDADLVNRVLLSFIFCMYYHMISGTFSSILPMWRRAAELFLFNEQILNEDRTSCDEIACMMALLEPEEASKTDVWAKRLESATSRSAYTPITNLWKNIARVAIVLPKLAHFVPAHSQYLQQFWDDLQLELLLEQVRDSPHYNLYGIWVYNMKGISAVNRNVHDYAGSEMNQSIRIVDQLSKQVANTSQQIYITRSLEHIHYIVTKMQERAPDSCAVELMLDQIEAMIAGEESSSSDDSSYYGNTNNNNNNTNQMYDIYHPISSDYLSYNEPAMISMVL